jgi:cytochrome c5
MKNRCCPGRASWKFGDSYFALTLGRFRRCFPWHYRPAFMVTCLFASGLLAPIDPVSTSQAAPPPSQTYKLTATSQAGSISVQWVGQGAQLEEANDVIGPWAGLAGATSPFQVTPSEKSRFYRLTLPPPLGPRALLVRGYIATRVGSQGAAGGITNATDVYLPGVEVYLRNASSGETGTSTLTDLSGRFTLPANEGRYHICWQAPGFVNGCSDQIYSVPNNTHVGIIRILPRRLQNTTVVHGKVQMGDGTSPRLLEPLANINAFATVELLDEAGMSWGEVFVNNFGEYLLPQVPGNRSIVLRAKTENAATDQRIFPEANLGGALFQPIGLVIRNSAPKLQDLFPADPTTGRWLKTMRVGRTARLTARATDADGDPIKFRWLVQPGSGALSALTGPEVIWTPPNTGGLYSVTVIAYDKKGGYDRSTYPLRVDDLGVPFSGKVDEIGGPAVPGAQVEINGQITATGPEGFFQIRVIDANRFVLNIRKAGYGLVSQIYDKNVIGGRWTMARASMSTHDPTQPIDVEDRRDERNCRGPLSARLNWKDFPKLAAPQWQDGSNKIVLPFGQLDVPLPGPDQGQSNRLCGPGISVRIPANTLVDQSGQPPTGNVTVQLFTVDLDTPYQMPGDFTVRTMAGDTRAMESYGAGSIEITAGTRRYNLRAGMTADVTIPVDPRQLASGFPPPATIPLLFYNETQGIWIEEGTATLAGNVYRATVSHFSAINTDQIKENQSCVRIISPTLPATYNLEYLIPSPGAAPVRNTVLINNAPPHRHVIYNLPSMVNIVLVPIRVDNNIPIGTFVVNTGGPQNPTDPNLPNDPPTYAACSTEVTLTELAVPDLPNSGEFLHGLFTFEASNLTELSNGGPDDNPVLVAALDQATSNYYQQIDPLSTRTTLDGFKTANSFGGVNEINVIYANAVDLGFGRNMHGVRNGMNTAAYVSNFGDIDTPDSADVADAVLNVNPVATVAMEYAPIEGDPMGDRVVKFFVYNNLGNRINAANLDKLGARPIPQLCMVCHGGEYPGGPVIGSAPPFNNVSDVKLGSKFLPFDLHAFVFAPAPNDKVSQQAKFKEFNQDIVAISPVDPAISEIVTEMYGGISQVDPNVQDEVFVVAGWNAQPMQQTMYRDVIGRSCRTCHASHSFPSLRFNLASQLTDNLAAPETRVCLQHVMPHSKLTHKLFWTSVNPHQPGIFQLFGDTYATGLNGWDGTLCGDFTPGGQTPVTDFTTKIQPIFTANCAVCHAGNSAPPNCKPMNLSSGNAYANIVNVLAGELATMNRIAPNNPNQSYLWHKINGTQGGLSGLNNSCHVSGMNQQMPPPSGGLSGSDIADIMSWINTGATP